MSTIRIVAALVIGVIGLGGSPVVSQRPEILYNCQRYIVVVVPGSGYTKCTSGTGSQRARVYCSNGVTTATEYGDWAGRGVASWEACNYGRAMIGIAVDHWP